MIDTLMTASSSHDAQCQCKFCAAINPFLCAILNLAAPCCRYGLPTSSSQCITGAIIGVGILEGANGVNWKQFGRQFSSWVATLFIVGAFTAALFSQVSGWSQATSATSLCMCCASWALSGGHRGTRKSLVASQSALSYDLLQTPCRVCTPLARLTRSRSFPTRPRLAT